MSIRLWFSAFAFSLVISLASRADTLPRADDINKLAQTARQTTDAFLQKSIKLRFQYEYSGRFLKERNRQKLYDLARRASDQLRAIAESQGKLKGQIEEYEGDDWDDRYGSTGLWRKLFADLYATNLNKCQIDFCVALCAEQAARDEILHRILARIDSLSQDYNNTAYLQLLKGKALALLARTDPAYKPPAKKEFDSLAVRSDMRHSTVFKIAIERIKLLGPREPGRPNKLTDELARSTGAQDLELVLSLACLQRRLNRPQAFEKTVRTWPQIENILGSLALADLSHRLEHKQLDLREISILEAELAAQTAWRNQAEDYVILLRRLSNAQEFRTPLILYVTAAASAKTSPTEAAELLIKAARLQKEHKSPRLNMEAEKIAEQAARLVCNMNAVEQADYRLVPDVLEAYRQIAGGPTDQELEYCYATALMEAGRKDEGAELLTKIAETPTASRRYRAKLDLIRYRIIEDYYRHRKSKTEISKELLDLLRNCTEENGPTNVRAETMRIYCQLLLDARDKAEAQKVLDILTDCEIDNDPNLNVFKSKALRHLGRLAESAECMAKICPTDNHEHVIEAERLLVRILDGIEQLQQSSADFARLLNNSQTIARYCERISLSTYGLIPVGRARLYLAEVSLLGPSSDQQKLSQIEKLLNALPDDDKRNNVDFLRCRARLLTARGEFAAAAGLWAKVAEIHKKRSPPPSQRSPKWWRARFYEFYCWAKMPQTQNKDVLHTIEVLQNSFADIPPLWAEKLNSLKQQCR
ncbi:MAG: hypothetical protein KAY65_10980 [Planctomycetes bacterium]|nr:hypothetical protein [Planctomycetota bacterium]